MRNFKGNRVLAFMCGEPTAHHASPYLIVSSGLDVDLNDLIHGGRFLTRLDIICYLSLQIVHKLHQFQLMGTLLLDRLSQLK